MSHPQPAIGNLDTKRLARAAARAAAREGRGEFLPIVFGGRVIAELPAEFPLDVLGPLQHVNLDIALAVQQAVANAGSEDAARANMEMVVSILAANPDLPREMIVAVKEIGRRLLEQEGYDAFVAARPTPWDVAALISDLIEWYGLSLGEALGSSTSSSPDGGTLNTTSRAVSASTPGAFGNAPGTPVSSASGASAA